MYQLFDTYNNIILFKGDLTDCQEQYNNYDGNVDDLCIIDLDTNEIV